MTHTPQVGTPERRGAGHWYVPSANVGYHVRWVSGRWVCTCPSHRWRSHLACKHIMAVRRFRDQGKAVSMG
jgi:hypothetical protein